MKLVVVNALVVVLLAIGTVVAHRHLGHHIAAKKGNYAACAATTKPKLVEVECGWSSLGQQQDAILYGDVFAIVALGLTDFLWRKTRRTGSRSDPA